jgi:hypothetical protein
VVHLPASLATGTFHDVVVESAAGSDLIAEGANLEAVSGAG